MAINENKSLKGSFAELISARILSGELKPGDRLPPERELALQTGISRSSINQGILDLERRGFLRIAPRKGTYVANYLENATPETLSAILAYDSALISSNLFRDLMDLRILVERECARLACGRMNTANLALLSQKVSAIYADRDEELVDALYAFHRCIVQLSGNAAYLMVFQSFEKMLRNLIEAHYSNREELKKCLPLYDSLAAAIGRGEAAEADKILCSMLFTGSDYLKSYLSQREKDGA